MTGSDLTGFFEARLKLLFLGIMLSLAVGVAGVAALIKMTTKPSQSPAPKIGFWKIIVIDDEQQQGYFCPDGGYQGRISDTHQGWWETWNGKEKSASYAEETQAKAAVEKESQCK